MIVDDLKHASQTAFDKLAGQLGDLPKPVLAAIGAGDVAIERLDRLRTAVRGRLEEDLGETITVPHGVPDATEVRDFATRLPGRARKVAEGTLRHVGDLAGEVPDKAQQLVADLPARAQEFANAVSRENLRGTVDDYTRRVADAYADLARRGAGRVEAHSEGRTAGGADRAPAKAHAGKPAKPKAAKPKAAQPKTTKAKATGSDTAAKKPTRKPAAKSAAKPASSKPRSPRTPGDTAE